MSDAQPVEQPFIPALGRDWLTPFYDAVAWLLGEGTMKRRLIAQAAIVPGHDVLDLGCGTGTLALLIKDAHPQANVSGVDIDPRILAIAATRSQRPGSTCGWSRDRRPLRRCHRHPSIGC